MTPDLTRIRREILRELALIDGASCHHGVVYYATTATQELARMQTAERLALKSDAAREAYLETLRMLRANGEAGCCFCNLPFLCVDDATLCGDRLIHATCEAEWSAFIDARISITAAGQAALDEDTAELSDARRAS